MNSKELGLQLIVKNRTHTFDTVHITMPIASLLNGESDENYTRVKQALLSLQKKIFTYEDEKNG